MTEATQTMAERVAKRHGAKFNRNGSWCRVSGLADQASGVKVGDELRALHYQVRSVTQENCGTWEVLFR